MLQARDHLQARAWPEHLTPDLTVREFPPYGQLELIQRVPQQDDDSASGRVAGGRQERIRKLRYICWTLATRRKPEGGRLYFDAIMPAGIYKPGPNAADATVSGVTLRHIESL